MRTLHFLLIFLLCACNTLSAKAPFSAVKNKDAEKQNLALNLILSDYDVIWGFDFISDHEILFTEREGNVHHLNLKTKVATKLTSLSQVVEKGQGGLLDLALHPDFKNNSLIFLTYSVKTSDRKYSLQLATAQFKDMKIQQVKSIFTAQPSFSTTHHFGSRISFDQNGHLFLTVGDRGRRDLAQSLKTHNGKVLRLKLDGSSPKDNPFTGEKKALPEIWSYGHRNPQGLFYDLSTKQLWLNEHGPRGGDEINIVQPGKNYGWPIITYGKEYHGPKIGKGTQKAGMEQPKKYYVPSIAPSGLTIYSGKKFKFWKNHTFSGALALEHVNVIDFAKKGSDGQAKELRLFTDLNERVRNIKESPSGDLFFSTDSGKLYRVSP